jgi:hypothetical protein
LCYINKILTLQNIRLEAILRNSIFDFILQDYHIIKHEFSPLNNEFMKKLTLILINITKEEDISLFYWVNNKNIL